MQLAWVSRQYDYCQYVQYGVYLGLEICIQHSHAWCVAFVNASLHVSITAGYITCNPLRIGFAFTNTATSWTLINFKHHLESCEVILAVWPQDILSHWPWTFQLARSGHVSSLTLDSWIHSVGTFELTVDIRPRSRHVKSEFWAQSPWRSKLIHSGHLDLPNLVIWIHPYQFQLSHHGHWNSLTSDM